MMRLRKKDLLKENATNQHLPFLSATSSKVICGSILGKDDIFNCLLEVNFIPYVSSCFVYDSMFLFVFFNWTQKKVCHVAD